MPDLTLSSDYSLLLLLPLTVVLFFIVHKMISATQSGDGKQLKWLQVILRFTFYLGLLFLLFNPVLKIKNRDLFAKKHFLFIDQSVSLTLADSLAGRKIKSLLNNSEIEQVSA